MGPGALKQSFIADMKAKAFQIHWHNKQPIYSVDFHPNNSNKLATCGGDNNVRVRGEMKIFFKLKLLLDMECR